MKGVLCMLLLCMAVGCADKNKYAGVDIIPQPKMVNVLWDIMQVDEFATGFIAKDSSKNLKRERLTLYQQVFRLHNISENQFSASYKYYSGKPDLMKMIFDTLGTRANRERQLVSIADSTRPR